MCKEELEGTLKRQAPFFYPAIQGIHQFKLGSFKWFSDSLLFIRDRVRDGTFSESLEQPGAYECIVAFEIIKGSEHVRRLNTKELMLDARKLPLMKFGCVKELPVQELARLALVAELQSRHAA